MFPIASDGGKGASLWLGEVLFHVVQASAAAEVHLPRGPQIENPALPLESSTAWRIVSQNSMQM